MFVGHSRLVPLFFVCLLFGSLLSPSAQAQIDFLEGKLDGLPQIGSASTNEPKVTVTSQFTAPEGDRPGMIYVTAEIEEGWHIYSLNQKPGGPLKSRIKLEPSDQYRLAGEWISIPKPSVHIDEKAWPGLELEEHTGSVTWQAPVTFAAGVDLGQVKIAGALNAQRCKTSCLPPKDFKFTAALAKKPPVASEQAQPVFVGEYQSKTSHARIQGHIEPGVAAAGGTVKLVLTATPESPYYVYALADRDPQEISKPTLIEFAETSGFAVTQPTTTQVPTTKSTEMPDGSTATVRYHAQPVTWTVDIKIPEDTKSGTYPIAGVMGYQTCYDGGCDLPGAVRFSAQLPVGAGPSASPLPLQFTDGKYGEAAKLAKADLTVAPQDVEETTSLPLMILFSLIGGLILNLMPCVLPVIGLKVLSFVDQAGHNRSQVLALNLWYSLGLVLVFLVLAAVAVSLNLKWGQQFTSSAFNIVLACVVFVMALSFLGVWEIPIPGFVGSGKAAHLAAKEGPSGAFAKGVLTTILATPCSGPFLGPVFAFTLTQPGYVTFLIFGCIGLGMASPYLLIGAVPSLIRYLPKPGAWMDTFKQMMGFVLLGTVVFLFSFMNKDYLVPTFALLVGLWAACWWIGRTPLTATFARRARAWGGGAVFASIVGVLAFTYLVPRDELLPWQPFSRSALVQNSSAGKTVMVDFTADWCLTCKMNLQFAINTEDVRDIVEENGIVPLLADWSQPSAEIEQMLNALNSASIPVLAIFPADRPNEPIILRDVITKGQLIEKLKEAGPSKDNSSVPVALSSLGDPLIAKE